MHAGKRLSRLSTLALPLTCSSEMRVSNNAISLTGHKKSLARRCRERHPGFTTLRRDRSRYHNLRRSQNSDQRIEQIVEPKVDEGACSAIADDGHLNGRC